MGVTPPRHPPGRQPAGRAGRQLAQLELGLPSVRAGSMSHGDEGVWSGAGGCGGVGEASREDGAASVGGRCCWEAKGGQRGGKWCVQCHRAGTAREAL